MAKSKDPIKSFYNSFSKKIIELCVEIDKMKIKYDPKKGEITGADELIKLGEKGKKIIETLRSADETPEKEKETTSSGKGKGPIPLEDRIPQ